MFRPDLIPKIMVIFTCILLAGCGSLVELPGAGAAPPRLFSLSPVPADTNSVSVEPSWAVFVEEPTVPGELRTDRIAVRERDLQISYLAGSKWSDHTPMLIRRHIRISLDNSSQFQAISDNDIEMPANYRLKMDVRTFHLVGGPNDEAVEVSVAVRLLQNGPVQLLGKTILNARRTTDGANAADVANRFDEALDEISADLMTWLNALLAAGGTTDTG